MSGPLKEKDMENLNLFGEETAPATRTIRLRSIRPVYGYARESPLPVHGAG
jgi:hypothetical protein